MKVAFLLMISQKMEGLRDAQQFYLIYLIAADLMFLFCQSMQVKKEVNMRYHLM